MNEMLTDALEKRETIYAYPKMFSAYFQNIRELRGFLHWSTNFVITNVPETLGVAYKVWQGIKKGREIW